MSALEVALKEIERWNTAFSDEHCDDCVRLISALRECRSQRNMAQLNQLASEEFGREDLEEMKRDLQEMHDQDDEDLLSILNGEAK